MHFCYKFITYLLYIFAPIYFFFRKLRKKEDLIRYKEKLAKINIARNEGFLIWFHVASVGEAMSILPLIESCMKEKKINKTPIGRTVYGGFSDAYFRCPPNEPSRTVKENHGGVFIHYEKNRFMTPRELARLQSFDDKFIFEGSKSQILVQIGNAVPPKLGYHIANTLKENL